MTISAAQPVAAPVKAHRPSYSRDSVCLLLLALCLMLVIVSALCLGAYPVTLADLGQMLLGNASEELMQKQQVILHIRLPRILMGALVGGSLAVCGAVMQALFINPLADPGLIGVSSGAALGAVLSIVFGFELSLLLQALGVGLLEVYLMPAAALIGAAATVSLVYWIAQQKSTATTDTALLLLAGIAIGTLTGACMGLLIFVSDEQQLRTLTFWMMGSLSGSSWRTLGLAAPALVLAILVLPLFHKALNLLLLGEQEAAYAGVSVKALKRWLIGWVALAVGVSVAFSGMIGFVGLIVPHLLRLSMGADHRLLLPSSVLLGAIVLCLADLLARTLVSPAELPIGIITSMLGGPFFLWLLLKHRQRL